MSYHILHQFDEQWLSELTEGDSGSKRMSFLKGQGGSDHWGRKRGLASRECRRWAVVAASLLLAAFSLLFALDASRRADTLQQRLDIVEAAVRVK